jgi:hypothetical protein
VIHDQFLIKMLVMCLAAVAALFAAYSFNQYELAARDVLMEAIPPVLLSLMPGSHLSSSHLIEDPLLAADASTTMEARLMQMVITHGVQLITAFS